MLVTVNFKDRLAEPHLGFPQKSFAVLDVLDHHVVLALSFKLVSFFTFIIAVLRSRIWTKQPLLQQRFRYSGKRTYLDVYKLQFFYIYYSMVDWSSKLHPG